MPRPKKDICIAELPLVASRADEREALVRLGLLRNLYNAALGEALKRARAMRRDPAWKRARRLDRETQKEERKLEFRRLAREHHFTEYDLQAYATQCKNAAKWNEGRERTDPRVGAHECQRLAEKVFSITQQWVFGKRGQPRFKGKNRPIHSAEGKSSGSGLRWNKGTGCLQWGQLTFKALIPAKGKDAWLEKAMKFEVKYARIVWRTIRGKRRWFAQLVLDGKAPRKYKTRKGVVGLDVGPSTVAVVGKKAATLVKFCSEVEQPWTQIRTLQRALERSRRATNPDCFNANGTWKKGARVSVRSRGYQRLQRRLAEEQRRLAAMRERAHGRLVNQVLALGNEIHAEKLSYRSFQKNFGRSVSVHAPGTFISLLRRKAESAGGAFIELNTRTLKLSQYDHTTNTFEKKPLSQRWHTLKDGSGVVQRDLYSAFLASVSDAEALHPSRAAKAWPVAQSLLSRAGWLRTEPTSVESLLSTAQALPAPEPVARQRALAPGNARPRSERILGGKALGSVPGTPCL
jgi:putative transposase